MEAVNVTGRIVCRDTHVVRWVAVPRHAGRLGGLGAGPLGGSDGRRSTWRRSLVADVAQCRQEHLIAAAAPFALVLDKILPILEGAGLEAIEESTDDIAALGACALGVGDEGGPPGEGGQRGDFDVMHATIKIN